LMETPEYIASLRVVGGDPAVDFVNTLDGVPGRPPTFDTLQTYGDLVAWARHAGLLTARHAARMEREAGRRPGDARAAHRRALELRDALYRVLVALAVERRSPAGPLERIKVFASEALAHSELRWAEGSFELRWDDPGDLDRITWIVASAATQLLTSARLDRVKQCAACRWVFIDTSKNRSRRWCDMEVCGTHEKARRYVARRAAARAARKR
jgi:predicted RNA-binding Zn ribbon-like protein